jgi:hypothetical protein
LVDNAFDLEEKCCIQVVQRVFLSLSFPHFKGMADVLADSVLLLRALAKEKRNKEKQAKEEREEKDGKNAKPGIGRAIAGLGRMSRNRYCLLLQLSQCFASTPK